MPGAAESLDLQLHNHLCCKLDYMLKSMYGLGFLVGCKTQTTSAAQKYHK